MAFIFLREESGEYYVSYINGKGKRICQSLRTRDRVEAQKSADLCIEREQAARELGAREGDTFGYVPIIIPDLDALRGYSVVYFIAPVIGGLVKIGVASSLERRFAVLQNGSPLRLEVLLTIPGDKTLEKKLHAQFSWLRSHGEWFTKKSALVSFIRRQREANIKYKVKEAQIAEHTSQAQKVVDAIDFTAST